MWVSEIFFQTSFFSFCFFKRNVPMLGELRLYILKTLHLVSIYVVIMVHILYIFCCVYD